MATIKYSRQRESIKKYLMSTKSHPTAEMVYEAVQKEYPNISLGTVYRNLSFLEQQGDIQKLSFGGDSERYDGNPMKHYHFICKGCHHVLDLDVMPLDHINVIAGNGFKGRIDSHQVYFYGECESCVSQADQKCQ